jgi:hypothetical protein
VRRLSVVVCLLLAGSSRFAASASAADREDKPFETLSILFPFYNDAFGFAAGYVYGRYLRPFYRSQGIDGRHISSTINTNGVDLGLTWDNRDFPVSPAHGQSVSVGLSRDFGAFNSSNSWTVWQTEVDQ